eukprot:scpid106277/ scgid21502/ 
MSESIEMATVADSSQDDSCLLKETHLASSALKEADETTTSVDGQEEKEQDGARVQAAAQDPCKNNQTAASNVDVEVNIESQNAGRISARAHKIFVLSGSFVMVLMFGMAVYIVLKLLKEV